MKGFSFHFTDRNVPIRERLFLMISFCVFLSAAVFALIGPFIRMHFYTMLVYAYMGVNGAFFYFLELKTHKTTLNTILLVSISLYGIYFSLIHLYKEITVEMPLYMILGFCVTTVLLRGKTRVIMIVVQLLCDSLVCFYRFYYTADKILISDSNTAHEYIRLELSVVITGLMCGMIISFRNKMLSSVIKDMRSDSETAEKTNYAKDMFLVNVSHEILTPLNAIIGVSDIILDSETNDRVKEMVYNINNSSHALLSITTDLLDFSRMNTDSLKAQHERFDFSLLLYDIINLMSVRVLDKEIHFFVNIAPDMPRYIIGDGGKIRQIIINLMSNAIKYTDEGRMTLTVSYECIYDKKIRLFVSVEDTGRGIKEENLETIFEPFRRLGNDDDKLVEGNGLGLPLCKKLVATMDGSLNVQSEYGKGSIFYFDVMQELPDEDIVPVTVLNNENVRIASFVKADSEREALNDVCAAMNIENTITESAEEMDKLFKYDYFDYFFMDAMAIDEIKSIHKGKPIDSKKIISLCVSNYTFSGEAPGYNISRPITCLNVSEALNQKKHVEIVASNYNNKLSLEKAKIMVVDDNIVNITVASGLLERYSPEIITASSGKEALRLFESNPVDYIFLDYMMPDMDGIDTLHELRKLKSANAKTVPVIALTANVVSGAKEMFLEAGFTDYLPKPIEVTAMEQMLVKYLPKDLISEM